MATLTSTPDAVLGRRLRERDHSAWEALYATHGPQLRAFALRLARDPHEADDLVQETFVRALPRLDKLDLDEIALRPYLFTTLRNTFLKSCDRRRRVAPVEEVPEPATPGAIEDDPEHSLLLHGQIEEVRLANASLAPRQRLALALRELEDCSYAEIGAIVGIKENAVAQLISRARDSLRNTLRLAQVDTADLPDTCRRLLPQLSRHLDGQLRGDQLERTLVHLDACEHCQDALEAMGEASRRYRGLLPPLLLTEDAHAAAIDAELTAAGFWESRPTRWSWGRSRPAPRSRRRSGPAPRAWRRSRRVAVLATAALLLGGGGALVLALPAQRTDRTAPGDRLAASAELGTASAAGQATAPPAPSGAGGPRSSASSTGAPAWGHASRSSALPPRTSSSPPRAGRATPARAPAAARARGSSEPAAAVSPDRAAPGAGRAPGSKTGAPSSRPAGGSAPPATTGSSTGTGTGNGAGSGPAADPDPASSSGPAPGTDPTPRRAANTTPPTTSITAAFTTADKARFSFTASESGATFACALDAGVFEPCTSSTSYSGLTAGRHSFSVRATDGAGNTGAADQHAWTTAEALPDLVITGFTETSVTIANVGSAAADPFVVSISLVGSVTFGGLAPGARATQTFACRSGALTATADPGNSIAESNEANNRRDFESLC